MFIGIDPGKTGAIAVVSNPSLAYVHHLPMPVVSVGKNTRINGSALSAFFAQFVAMGATINLELVHSMPRDGSKAAFSFGHSCGVIEGVLQAMNLPYNLVTPQAWKKHAGLIGTDKDAARSRCVQLYPGLRILDLKGKGQALADALLLARYSAR